MWEYLFLLQTQCVTPLVLFKRVDQWPSGMAPAFSISDFLETGRREVPLLEHERGVHGPTALCATS